MGFTTGARLEALCRRAELAGFLHEEMSYDAAHGTMVVRVSQDCDSILDANKDAAAFTDGYTPNRLLRRVASIPNVVIHQWLREGINVHTKEGWERAKRKLRDPEFRYFRTSPGRI